MPEEIRCYGRYIGWIEYVGENNPNNPDNFNIEIGLDGLDTLAELDEEATIAVGRILMTRAAFSKKILRKVSSFKGSARDAESRRKISKYQAGFDFDKVEV